MFREGEQGIFDPQPSTFVRGQLPENMDRVAFTMKVGQWGEVEDTPNRIALIYLVGRDRKPLSEVMSIVQKRVQGDKMQAKLDDLKKKTGIWMDPEYFKRGAVVEKDAGEQHPQNQPPSKIGNSAEIQEHNNDDVRQK
jgi:hypothetical protein